MLTLTYILFFHLVRHSSWKHKGEEIKKVWVEIGTLSYAKMAAQFSLALKTAPLSTEMVHVPCPYCQMASSELVGET